MEDIGCGVVGLLLFGTVTSLLAKIIFGIPSTGLDGQIKDFRKPLFEVFAMFYGMSFCVILDWLQTKDIKTVSSPYEKEQRHHSIFVICYPALLDLVATSLMCFGLLYTTVSVYQMLRGAMLIFTALFSVIFLKRKLTIHHYSSILLNVTGITLVGLANILAQKDAALRGNLLMGIMLMIAGQCAQAAQVVVEEYFCQDLNMPSIRVVTYEGLFGMLTMIFVVFPIAYLIPGKDSGSFENLFDSLAMIVNSSALQCILIMDASCMLFFNYFSMNVTKLSSSVFRTLLETMRTMIVWIVDIFLYYIVSNGRFGEPWTEYSFLQVIGFTLLVIGTFQYSQYSTLPATPAKTAEEEQALIAKQVTLGKQIPKKKEMTSAPIEAATESKPKVIFNPSSPSIFMRHGGFSPLVYSPEMATSFQSQVQNNHKHPFLYDTQEQSLE